MSPPEIPSFSSVNGPSGTSGCLFSAAARLRALRLHGRTILGGIKRNAGASPCRRILGLPCLLFEIRGCPRKFLQKRIPVCIRRRPPGDHHQIHGGRQTAALFPENIPDQTLNPNATYCVSHPLAHRNAKPAASSKIWMHKQNKSGACIAQTPLLYLLNLAPPPQTAP